MGYEAPMSERAKRLVALDPAIPRWVKDMLDGPDERLVPVCSVMWRLYDHGGHDLRQPHRWPTRRELTSHTTHRYADIGALEAALLEVNDKHHEVFVFEVKSVRGRPKTHYGFRPWLYYDTKTPSDPRRNTWARLSMRSGALDLSSDAIIGWLRGFSMLEKS